MPRNSRFLVDWTIAGPQALAWLRAEAPRRSLHRGLRTDCAKALATIPHMNVERLNRWIDERAKHEWRQIIAMVGTGLRGAPPPSPYPGAGLAPRSLVAYLGDKKRATCPVCALPEDVKAQLAMAGERGIKVAERLEWLTVEVGVTLTRADLETHGRHGP